MGPDAFKILDSQKFVHKLIPGSDQEDTGVSVTEKVIYLIGDSIDMKLAIKPQTFDQLGFKVLLNYKWPNMQITNRGLSVLNNTIGLRGDQIVIKTFSEVKQKVEKTQSMRGSMFLIGVSRLKGSNGFGFFSKPNPGSRAIDCLGLNGPVPTQI